MRITPITDQAVAEIIYGESVRSGLSPHDYWGAIDDYWKPGDRFYYRNRMVDRHINAAGQTVQMDIWESVNGGEIRLVSQIHFEHHMELT